VPSCRVSARKTSRSSSRTAFLTLRGERKLEKVEGLTWHRVERSYGNFSRTFTLPRTVDPEKITASYREGVLEIEAPKREEAKPKQIRIAVQ
jgi:HSP20 family protein